MTQETNALNRNQYGELTWKRKEELMGKEWVKTAKKIRASFDKKLKGMGYPQGHRQYMRETEEEIK